MSQETGNGMAGPCSRALPYIKPPMVEGEGPVMVVPHDDAPVVRDLENGLLVCYVVDQGEVLVYLQNRDLHAAGIDAAALHAVAMENLQQLIAKQMRVEPYGGIFALLLGGHFEASLLLVDELWDGAFARHAPNGFVAAVPARDILAFADAASDSGIEELRALIDRVTPGGDHLISSRLFRRENGTWNPLPEPRRGLLHALRRWIPRPFRAPD